MMFFNYWLQKLVLTFMMQWMGYDAPRHFIIYDSDTDEEMVPAPFKAPPSIEIEESDEPDEWEIIA